MWWGGSFPVFTTEIFYFILVNLVMGFPFNNFSFPPLHVPKWKSRGKKKMLSWNLLHRRWRMPAYVLGFEVPAWLSVHFFYHYAFDHHSVAGWCQWVVVLNAAALLAKGRLFSCLPPCLLLKYLWGGQGQPCSWYGENDLNMSGIYSVKLEIQTLFISLC